VVVQVGDTLDRGIGEVSTMPQMMVVMVIPPFLFFSFFFLSIALCLPPSSLYSSHFLPLFCSLLLLLLFRQVRITLRLHALEKEAAKAGGALIRLIGNHEVVPYGSSRIMT
jgi:hypothetical protein